MNDSCDGMEKNIDSLPVQLGTTFIPMIIRIVIDGNWKMLIRSTLPTPSFYSFFKGENKSAKSSAPHMHSK